MPVRLSLIFALTFATAMTGCAANGDHQTKLPTLGELRSRVPPHYRLPPDTGLPKPRGVVVVQTLNVPLTANLGNVWKMIHEDVFAKQTRDVWHANGLRVGLINVGDLKKLSQALPRVLSNDKGSLTGSEHPAPLIKGNILDKPITVTLPGSDGGFGKTLTIQGGRAQLLETVTRDAGGNLFLELLPHHYKPAFTLRPESPLKRQLNGRIFYDLDLRTQLSPGMVLVLGLYQRNPPRFTIQNQIQDQHQKNGRTTVKEKPHAPASQPDQGRRKAQDLFEHLPPTFGKAMLVDYTFAVPAQQLVFIAVQPMPEHRTPAPGLQRMPNP